MTEEKATFCRVCGRRLTAPESVKAGIGPVCEKRLASGEIQRPKNPICGKCGNRYDPRKIQTERTIFPPSGPISQWHCDRCGAWVDLP